MASLTICFFFEIIAFNSLVFGWHYTSACFATNRYKFNSHFPFCPLNKHQVEKKTCCDKQFFLRFQVVISFPLGFVLCKTKKALACSLIIVQLFMKVHSLAFSNTYKIMSSEGLSSFNCSCPNYFCA